MSRYTMVKQVLLCCICVIVPLAVQAGAPSIELIRVDSGNPQALSDYIGKGKWVVVNVWSPSCGFCVRELPLIESFHTEHGNEITVLGVTIDFPSFGYGRIDVIEAFLAGHPLDYPLFLADMDMASELIGIRLTGIPLIAIFHPDGRPLVRWPGRIELNEINRFIRNYAEPDADPLTTDF